MSINGKCWESGGQGLETLAGAEVVLISAQLSIIGPGSLCFLSLMLVAAWGMLLLSFLQLPWAQALSVGGGVLYLTSHVLLVPHPPTPHPALPLYPFWFRFRCHPSTPNCLPSLEETSTPAITARAIRAVSPRYRRSFSGQLSQIAAGLLSWGVSL